MDMQADCLARFNATHCPSCDLTGCTNYDDKYCKSGDCPSYFYFQIYKGNTG